MYRFLNEELSHGDTNKFRYGSPLVPRICKPANKPQEIMTTTISQVQHDDGPVIACQESSVRNHSIIDMLKTTSALAPPSFGNSTNYNGDAMAGSLVLRS
jgi:hypothetical protein